MQKKFECRDYFMIRTPVFNVDSTDIDSDLFMLSILLGSPSLFDSIKYKDKVNDKKSRDIKNSFYRYYNRMLYRSTPFGLFAGINVGRVGNNTNLIRFHNVENSDIYVDISYELFNRIISDIEKKSDVYNFNLSLNTFMFKTEHHYIINNDKYTKIERTMVLDNIYDYLNENREISFLELSKLIVDTSNCSLIEEVNKYIFTLINNDILVTNLRDGRFSFLYKKLLKIDSEYDLDEEHHVVIKKISEIINCIHKLFYEGKYESIQKVILDFYAKINENYNIKSPLKIDLKIGMDKCVLDKKVIQKALDGLFRFIILSHQSYEERLSNYHSLFLEEYGVDQLVDIRQCIDKYKGLDIPIEVDNLFEYDKEVYKEMDKRYYRDKHCIMIDDTVFDKLNCDINFQNSGELYCYIYQNRNKECVIEFSELVASFCAGNSFGRFLPLIDDETAAEIMNVDSNTVDVVEYPTSDKGANVTNSTSWSKNKMALGTFNKNNMLSIDDIYIGADLTGFYLFSVELNKKISVNIPSMINYEYQSPLYQTLFKLSHYSIQFPKKIMNQYSFHIPRIQWENVIFQSERWNLDKNMISHIEREGYNYLFDNYQIPQYVWITDNDNRLYINLKDKNDVDLLISELKQKEQLWISEDVMKRDNLQLIVKDEKEYQYQSEYIIPFDLVGRKRSEETVPSEYVDNQDELQKLSLMDNWLYFIFYVEENSQLKCISNTIYNLVLSLMEKKILKKWFFIRYKDQGKDSVRLRVQLNNDVNNFQIFYDIFRKWYISALSNDEIGSYEIKNYIPEISRYGGKKLIKECELLFQIDSEYIISQYLHSNSQDDLQDGVAITGYFILKSFGLSDDRIVLMTDEFVTNEQKQVIHKNRNQLLSLAKNNFANLRDKFPFLNYSFDEYRVVINNILEKTHDMDNKRIERIIMSILHMHCNRGYGVNPDLEGIAVAKINTIAKGMKYIG